MTEREPTDDLLDSSRWRPLRLLLDSMDQQIASVYDDAGVAGMRTRFVGPLIAVFWPLDRISIR